MKLGPENPRIFRITHVTNVPWILDHGIHCQNATTSDPDFVPIGMPDLIVKRKSRVVDDGPGGTLADYVPFYFTPWSIMMYYIKTGYNGVTKQPNSEIAVLVSSLQKLQAAGVDFLFTNGHAYMQETEYFDDLKDIHRVDWNLLQRRSFSRDPEDPGKLARYQAEALAHRHVPVDALLGIVCYDDPTRLSIARDVERRGIDLKVKALPQWYF